MADDDGLNFDFEEQLDVQPELPAEKGNLQLAIVSQEDEQAAAQQVAKEKNYRQTVCAFWLRGMCMKGEACGFLHKFDPERMPVCRVWMKTGECKELECPFKHSLDDVKECNMYKLGFCIYGPNCRYKHTKQPGPPPDPDGVEAAKPREHRDWRKIMAEDNARPGQQQHDRDGGGRQHGNKRQRSDAGGGREQQQQPMLALPAPQQQQQQQDAQQQQQVLPLPGPPGMVMSAAAGMQQGAHSMMMGMPAAAGGDMMQQQPADMQQHIMGMMGPAAMQQGMPGYMGPPGGGFPMLGMPGMANPMANPMMAAQAAMLMQMNMMQQQQQQQGGMPPPPPPRGMQPRGGGRPMKGW